MKKVGTINVLLFQVEGGESDGLVLEAGQPLPTHRTLRVTSPSDKVTLSFTQAHPDSPQLVLKGEVGLKFCSFQQKCIK